MLHQRRAVSETLASTYLDEPRDGEAQELGRSPARRSRLSERKASSQNVFTRLRLGARLALGPASDKSVGISKRRIHMMTTTDHADNTTTRTPQPDVGFAHWNFEGLSG